MGIAYIGQKGETGPRGPPGPPPNLGGFGGPGDPGSLNVTGIICPASRVNFQLYTFFEQQLNGYTCNLVVNVQNDAVQK